MMQVDQNVNNIIDHIASKLQVPTKELLKIMSRESTVEGWVQIGFCVLGLILVAIIIKIVIHYMKQDEFSKSEAKKVPGGYYSFCDGHDGIIVSGSVIASMGGILCLLILADGIIKVVNPSFYVINQIISAISKR